MRTRVQKWGNSLALRIPKSFAVEVGLADDTEVDVTVMDGQLVVAPVAAAAYSLDALLASITDDNLHGEVAAEPALGDEAW